MADISVNKRTRMSKTVLSALTWFRTVFVKSFAQGSIVKKDLARIVQDDKEFLVQLFRLMDSDQSGTLCYQEFIGSLLGLGRGRDVSDRAFTNVTLAFALKADSSGEVDQANFIALCLEGKLSDCLFNFFDLDDSGAIDVKEFLMGLDKIARIDTDSKWYTWAEKWFLKNASEDGFISKEQFLKYLNVTKSSFADSLFSVVDHDRSGTVDVTELMHIIHVLTQGSPTERLLLLFNMYDVDGDGRLHYNEITAVLERCLVDSSLEGKLDLVGKLADVLFQQLDTDNSGDISLAEFEVFLNQYPRIAENLTISFAQCLRSDPRRNLLGGRIRRKLTRNISLIFNYRSLIVFWCLFTAVNVTLFVTAARRYWDNSSIYLVLARGAGMCLNFNSAFIVVLMYKNIITYLKITRLRKYLPLDYTGGAHKLCGAVIVVFSLLHAAMHVPNAEILSSDLNITWTALLFTPQHGVGWVGGSAFITGWILVLVLGAIAGPSLICLRRRGYFQFFYWSHWLFIGWWAVLVIHAPNFWKWLVGPATVYLLEKLWRHFHSHEKTIAFIRSIRSVDSKVSEVIIERPRRFKFNAGEYILINIKAIAKFEWHPFTISSAPEQTDILTLHVEVKGDWTSRLRSLGETMCSDVRIERIGDDRDIPTGFNCTLDKGEFRGDNSVQNPRFSYSNIAFETEEQSNEQANEEQRANDQVDLAQQQRSEVSPKESTRQSKPSVVTQTDRRFSEVVTPIGSAQRREPPASLLLTRSHPNKHLSRTTDSHFNAKLQVSIDGPFGAPSTDVYNVDHAILIGAGIGVTPFASILQSMMYRRKLQRAICPNCKHWWRIPGVDGFIRTPRRVDFIWVTRTFDALEWFLSVLSELEEEEALLGEEEKFLNICLHITSALAQSDIRAVALQMALELCHQEESRDPLCGLRTRIQPGRPHWKKLFDNLLVTSEGRKCVFYCGPPGLEKILKDICGEYRLGFKSENF